MIPWIAYAFESAARGFLIQRSHYVYVRNGNSNAVVNRHRSYESTRLGLSALAAGGPALARVRFSPEPEIQILLYSIPLGLAGRLGQIIWFLHGRRYPK
jgi:hypothetical protein